MTSTQTSSSHLARPAADVAAITTAAFIAHTTHVDDGRRRRACPACRAFGVAERLSLATLRAAGGDA